MNLTLRQLQIFCSIARTGSTAAAAEQVALSQSAASAALNELERTLATTLFDRVGKRLVLNDNGRAILPTALSLLDSAQALEQQFREKSTGFTANLRIHASMTTGNYILPPLLARFRKEVQPVQIQLFIGNTRDVIAAVSSFDVDLGLIEGPCHCDDLIVIPWMDDELVVVAAPNDPLAGQREDRREGQTEDQRDDQTEDPFKGKVGIEALREARWLLREAGSGTREATDNALLPHLQRLHVAMTLGSPEAIKNAVAAGLGVGCLSRAAVADLVDAHRLVILDTGLPPLTRQLALVHHKKKTLSQSLSRFIEFCTSPGASR